MKPPFFWRSGLDPWSREAAPLTRLLLTPAAIVYAALTARRFRKTTPRRVKASVICVGNLTAGGTGKSPVVQKLRQELSDQTGRRVATLSRGYGGTLAGPLSVDASQHAASDVGDEPLMLAHHGESWIGRDRAAAGAAMAEDGVEIILMDDGHQNPTLNKDVSILVVDAESGFGNGYVIPKGPLREPEHIGLARADLIVAMGDGALPDSVDKSGKPVFRAHIKPLGAPPPGPYVAFAGIGRPEKFFDSLNALGADVRDAVPFDDHHVYRSDDMKYLSQLALDHNAKLITTEKDFARLNETERAEIVTLPVAVEFEDLTGLMHSIELALKTRDPNGASE